MIELEYTGSVLTLTLARSPVNAINDEWIDRFNAILDELGMRTDVSVLVLRSSQRSFSAGADLKLMRECFTGDAGRARMLEVVRRMQRLYDRIERLPQVTIAVLGGAAFGGGFELALSCDLRVAADGAQLGLPEARLGLLPGAGGTQRLTRLCGPGAARRLILTAETLDGSQAKTLGIVQWAVPAAGLDGFALQLAQRVAALSPHALAACKQCLGVADGSSQHGMAVELHLTAALFAHADTRQRVNDFLQR